MFSTKYHIESIEEFSKSNPMHDEIMGKICYPAYFKVGERGIFLVDTEKEPIIFRYDRILTSLVKEVVTNRDGGFTVTTKNSKYIFKAVMEE